MEQKPHLILIVEDNPDQLRIMAEMLRAAGYNVASSLGAEPALRKAKAFKPDLILTDLAMPQVSGVQLVDQLRNDPELMHVPIIAVTAYVWDNLAQAAANVGVDAFIAKPYTRTRLLAEVEKQLKKK